MGINIEKNVQPSEDLEDLSIAITRRTSIARILIKHSLTWVRYSLERLPIKMTLSNLGILAVVLAIVMPRSVTYVLLYPIFRVVFGNLYPAYASYKAVRTKNIKEYVKWMMYWIVFALFTCAETFTDVFFSFWFPFYYEIKTILVVWLLSPATKGSSILYRRFVHPALIRREAEIDEALARATEQGYTAVLHLGSKGVNYATTVLMQTAIKGGGGLVQHLRKSYSLSDLTGEKEDENRNTPHMHDETDMEVEPRRRENVGRRGYSPRRTQSSSNRVEMYFSEVDVDVRQARSREPVASLTNIRSSDDISNGYSSGETLQSHRTTSQGDSLVRTSSVGARTRVKPRSTTKKTPEDAGEDSDYIDLPSSKNILFPTPLSLVTPDQALELLLLLSQNSNINEYIRFDRELHVVGNDDIGSTSQSGPKIEGNQPEPKESCTNFVDELNLNVQTIESIDVKTVPNDLPVTKNIDKPVTLCAERRTEETKCEDTETKETVNNVSDIGANEEVCPKSSENSVTGIDPTKFTDEICQHKFDELKQLLSDAHKAVNSIVYTHEKSKSNDTIADGLSQNDKESVSIKETDSNKELKENEGRELEISSKKDMQSLSVNETEMNDKKNSLENEDATTSLEVWTTPNISRSNSDSNGRAGKYNKKPAPKVPLTASEEDLIETESQNALKATLVIKTGTLKTFSNVSTTKDVFVAHAPDAKVKGKKSRKQRTKEGFSKLLTIPKNIFHNAFSKEHKDSGKVEDTSSEISGSESRSNSIESQEVFIELAPKLSTSHQDINIENVSLHATDDNHISNVDTTVKQSSDTSACPTLTSDNNVSDADGTVTEKEGSIQSVTHGAHSSGKDIQVKVANSSESQIREMSQSPKIIKRIVSDIY